MMKIIEEYPFATILALVGLFMGLILPSGLDILSNFDFSQASKDPQGFITGYVIAVPVAIFIELISGLIGALIMGIIGLMIDITRNSYDLI